MDKFQFNVSREAYRYLGYYRSGSFIAYLLSGEPMASNSEKENPLRAYYEREFAELYNLKSHRALSAAAALYLCKLDGQVPPHWAVEEAAELLCDLLANKPKKRGRSANIVARYKQ